VKTSDLKPCPFCGTTPNIRPWHGGGPMKRLVRCRDENCLVVPMVSGTTRSRAIAAWNQRATPPTPSREGRAQILDALNHVKEYETRYDLAASIRAILSEGGENDGP
jgi:hypothetical protein